MEKFEDDVLLMIKNIEFRRVNNDFQSKLKDNIKKISSSNNVFVFADKTANMYELPKDQYDKLLQDNITFTYRKTNDNIKSVDQEANDIAVKLGIEDIVERMTKNQAFIILKDHKNNFINNPKSRLINTTKSDIGRISKQILEKINKNIRETSKHHQ